MTRRLLLSVAIVGLLAGAGGVLTGVAVANHQFPDVPTSSAFHDAIDNFANAGCATGFPDGTFRPQDPVLRQQMARFVNACGGRIDSDSGILNAVTGTAQTLLSLHMESGALQGAGIFAVQANVHINSVSTTGFPCEVNFNFSSVNNDDVFLDLPLNTSDTFEDANGTIGFTFPLESGSNSTIFLQAHFTDSCTATVRATADATMTYFPFQGNGAGGGESAPVEELSPIHG